MSTLLKVWYSAAELASLRLPGLPVSKKAILAYFKRLDPIPEGFIRDREGKGGGHEYHVSLLPPSARKGLPRDTLPPAFRMASRPQKSRQELQLARSVHLILPPRFDGSPKPSLTEVRAALYMLGYRES